MLDLSIEDARALLLAAQGLQSPPDRPAEKEGLLACIQRMAALQIDTIHIVNRSPYLVLWSRLGGFELQLLDDLLAEGKLFEYWAHAACFLPIEDFPLFRRQMLSDFEHSREWLQAHPDLEDHVMAVVRERGEVKSVDFERTDGKSGTWWNWKPEKRALESLFWTGRLMIARRERFQRVYAPLERVLPDWDDSRMLSADEARRQLVLKTVRALGVARAKWVSDYFKQPKTGISQLLEQLVDEGGLQHVRIEGWKEEAYLHPENAGLAAAAAEGTIPSTVTTLLSPFDPVIWDRTRGRELFDFSYSIEVYTPAPKRRYGYFTLPILHRGRLVGRLDPKAHRKEGLLEIRALHLEPGIEPDGELMPALHATLRDFAHWHGLREIVIRESDPPGLRGSFHAA